MSVEHIPSRAVPDHEPKVRGSVLARDVDPRPRAVFDPEPKARGSIRARDGVGVEPTIINFKDWGQLGN
jgi:hypothetical protein